MPSSPAVGVTGASDGAPRESRSGVTRPDFQLILPDCKHELERAADRESASFAQVFQALDACRRSTAYAISDEFAAPCKDLHSKLLAGFENEHGPIERSFYGHEADIHAAAVITRHTDRRDRALELHTEIYWHTIPFDTTEARIVYTRLRRLRDRVTSFLIPSPFGLPSTRKLSHSASRRQLPASRRPQIGREAYNMVIRDLHCMLSVA